MAIRKKKRPVKEPHLNSCHYCRNRHTDSEGEMGYTYYSFDYCSKNEAFQNLKSFPFKTERKCFELCFWAAIDRDEELKRLCEEDVKSEVLNVGEWKSFNRYKEKYLPNEK